MGSLVSPRYSPSTRAWRQSEAPNRLPDCDDDDHRDEQQLAHRWVILYVQTIARQRTRRRFPRAHVHEHRGGARRAGGEDLARALIEVEGGVCYGTEPR